MSNQPKFLRDDRMVRIAAYHSVLMHVWLGTATPDAMREVCELELEFAKQQRDRKYALISVVRLPNITGFGADARRELEIRMQKIEPFLGASVTLLPTHSLAASIVRAIITGLSLVARSRAPNTVVATVEEACAWLAPRIAKPLRGEPIGVADLRLVLDRAIAGPTVSLSTRP